MATQSGLAQAASATHEMCEFAGYSETLSLLHEGACSETGWSLFEAALVAAFRASEVTFTVQPTGVTSATQKNSQRLASLEIHRARAFAREMFMGLPNGIPMTIIEYAACAELGHARDALRRWAADTGNPFVLGLDVSDEHFQSRLRIVRGRQHGDFTPHEKAHIAQLATHLRTAARNHIRLNRALAERSWFAGQLLPAVIFLDDAGAVAQISETAQQLLSRERALHIENNVLRLSRADDAAVFQRIVARVLASARGVGGTERPEAMSVRRASGQPPLWVVVRPLRSTIGGLERLHVAVLISVENGEDCDVPIDGLQHLLGLTRSEATVALQLARGKTVKEVTEELGVSLSTTRTHLRSIFAKTSIDKQTKLVRTVLQGVAMLGGR